MVNQYVFNLKNDIAVPQSDGSYIVYLKSVFKIGYYVDKYDPISKEAILGLALYKDGKEVVRIGNPLRVTESPTYGPVTNKDQIDQANEQLKILRSQLSNERAVKTSLEMQRLNILKSDPSADTSNLDNQILQKQQLIDNIQSQIDSVVIPEPVYSWVLDFDTLVSMAPNLSLTPQFIDFAKNIETSIGVKIGDIVDLNS